MKNFKHHLQRVLLDCVQANLGELNESHPEKLQKLATKAASRLVEKLVKLQGKQQKQAKKEAGAAARSAHQKNTSQASQQAPQLAAPTQLEMAVRAPRRKTVASTLNASK